MTKMPQAARLPTNGMSEMLLTVRNIAELDQCSVKSVRRAIAAGLLEVVRIGPGGRLLRVTRSIHEAYRRVQQAR